MIKTIIFDLGNVLLDFKPLQYLKNMFNDDEIVDILYNEIYSSEEWLMLDKGTITQEDAVKIFCDRNPDHHIHIKKCMDNWFYILTPIKESVDILMELKKKGYKLLILSNFHHLAFETVSSKFDFFKCFDGGIVSYEENLLKPQEEIFNKLLKKYNIKAEESLFIDDTLCNVEAAHRLGLEVIHFKNSEDLQFKLNEMNLL